MGRWGVYHAQVGDRPNSMVVRALSKFVTRRSASLDLGAGNLRDSKFMLGRGFTRVVAVDISEESLAFATTGIDLRIAPIETFVPEKDTYDFAFCCNSLFFLSVEQVASIFKNVLIGLRSGGVFTCNVLGQEDDWVTRGREASWFSKETLVALSTGFRVLETSEQKEPRDVMNSLGFVERSKLCHGISITVQKP